MIKANGSHIELKGTDGEVIPEFLAIYKLIEANFKEAGHNFRSLFLSILFDEEFEKIQPSKVKSKIINFNDIMNK